MIDELWWADGVERVTQFEHLHRQLPRFHQFSRRGRFVKIHIQPRMQVRPAVDSTVPAEQHRLGKNLLRSHQQRPVGAQVCGPALDYAESS